MVLITPVILKLPKILFTQNEIAIVHENKIKEKNRSAYSAEKDIDLVSEDEAMFTSDAVDSNLDGIQ